VYFRKYFLNNWFKDHPGNLKNRINCNCQRFNQNRNHNVGLKTGIIQREESIKMTGIIIIIIIIILFDYYFISQRTRATPVLVVF